MSKKQLPTLADECIRFLLSNPKAKIPSMAGYPVKRMANTIANANRVVLDDPMSAYLADLANEAFPSSEDRTRNLEHSVPLLENIRQLSRLPFPTTWVEYNYRACHRRQVEAYSHRLGTAYEWSMAGDKPLPFKHEIVPSDEIPPKEAWLLEQHPQLETAFRATVVVQVASHPTISPQIQGLAVPFAFSWAWTVEDTEMPWPAITAFDPETHPSILSGFYGYKTPFVRCVFWDEQFGKTVNKDRLKFNIQEWGGNIRYLWAFLSTLNELRKHVEVSTTVPSKGFVVQGRHRKFLSHSTIHLKVPGNDAQRIAKRMVQQSRKRAHMVRGHWRKLRAYQHKVWIKPHQRGDASLGWVTHDYSVEHKE